MILLYTFLIIFAGSFLPAITTPRPLFWMWQQVYRAEEVKPNLLNGWIYRIADHFKTPVSFGLCYGSLRGLYEIPITIALAILYQNWIIAPLGLLGGFQGLVYLMAGKLSKDHATKWAEIGYGGVRGCIYGLAAWMVI